MMLTNYLTVIAQKVTSRPTQTQVITQTQAMFASIVTVDLVCAKIFQDARLAQVGISCNTKMLDTVLELTPYARCVIPTVGVQVAKITLDVIVAIPVTVSDLGIHPQVNITIIAPKLLVKLIFLGQLGL